MAPDIACPYNQHINGVNANKDIEFQGEGRLGEECTVTYLLSAAAVWGSTGDDGNLTRAREMGEFNIPPFREKWRKFWTNQEYSVYIIISNCISLVKILWRVTSQVRSLTQSIVT